MGVRFPVKASSGNANTDNADMRSANMLTVLVPNRPIHIPPNGATMSEDTPARAITNPAYAGEPDTSSMSHGIVIMTTAFDTPEKKLEICI